MFFILSLFTYFFIFHQLSPNLISLIIAHLLSLHIECIDDTVDLCSNGHYYYGICILAICAIPGILFAVSDYINFRGFTFGKLLGNPMLRNWPGIIKLVLLPVYAAFMVTIFFQNVKLFFCWQEFCFHF